MSEISNSDLSLPEVCISTNSASFEEDMDYEVQQAYRIFTGFLLDKHKGITSPFLHPIGHLDAQHGIGGVRGRGQAQLRQSMCLRRMEEKFVSQEYDTITEFVADFRLMLENCYRYHGVDHWISKQAQKLEIMLEQKLTLLSRTLREKTTLAVTSKGRFGAEEERSSGGTSTRRRSAPRSLATITVGGHESVMVQALRLEEQQRAKEEKRQRELEKKEAEEMSAKEVEEWEQSLLSQASPQTVDTLWELPAIGHFLCLAQTALNLPEIVFYELERCLLMPRCSLFLCKIMSSLLCPPQRRATLHRRPALPYRRWESELRQRVLGWYRALGASRDQPGRAEQLGLCHQFFSILGEVSPLEETPFHLLPFYQRVWLLKGLCDNIYETQKDVQDAVLAQPIHECRESILGYDSMENAYIHFPHFCGADLRIYCQSPSIPPDFPFPPVWVKRIEIQPGTEGEESDGVKEGVEKSDTGCYRVSGETGESEGSGKEKEENHTVFKRENGGREEKNERFNSWSLKVEEEESDSGSSDEDESSEDSKSHLKMHTNSSYSLSHNKNPLRGSVGKNIFKKEQGEHQSNRLTIKQELGSSMDSGRTIKAETQEPCLSVGEHSYTGRSPARSKNLASPVRATEVKMEGGGPAQGHHMSSCLECSRSNTDDVKSEQHNCCCGTSGVASRLSSESTQNSSEERVNDRIRTKKKKRKKKRERAHLPEVKGEHRQLRRLDTTMVCQAQAAKPTIRRAASAIKRKDKRKKHKAGKKVESSKKIKGEPEVEPSFKLVCTSLEELRDLISKTEDELDELESTKKRSGRWYFRREAVKDLHITLIRLLNELSPWEPKLVKAYQRNRLRLKKEFDDFKKHPDYNYFVREECVSSSSDDEDGSEGKEVCSLPDHYRGAEEEDLEHAVPRGLWTGGNSRQFVAESAGGSMVTYINPNHLKHPLSSTDEDINLLQRGQTGSNSLTSTPDSGLEPRSEPGRTDQSRDANPAWAAAAPVQASLGPRPTILHPTVGLPKGYTPIPTLLAKSVGNKVTLMKRPTDYLGVSSHIGQSKGRVCSLPTSVVATTTPHQAQRPPSQSQHNSHKMHTQGQQQTHVDKQSVIATTTAALPKPPQAKLTQVAVPKSPVQVVYKVPEELGHLLRKDSSNPVKISVQPIVDQNTGEKVMQQVVILPSNLLIQKNEEKVSSHYLQPQSKSIQAPISKVAGPLCMSTNVPGFTIPDGRIPVQQVAPLKDARIARIPSTSVSPCLQQNPVNTAGLKVAQACSSQDGAPHGVMPSQLSITTSGAVPTDPITPTDPKQELKTVCIRDSQSILVTTRGGNTGIVKVQTSSDQTAPGSLPASPVITISPQFKAFLVSKTSPPLSPAPSQTSSCTIPAATSISTVQPQKQAPSVLKSPTVTASLLTAVTGSAPLAGPVSQTTGTTVTLSKTHSSSGSIVTTRSGQAAQTIAASSHLHSSLVKGTVIVPSLSGSGTPHVPTQTQFINKTGMKRASTDERSQFTKFILVTPSSSSLSSSSSSSNATVPKVTSSSTTPLPGSRVMFISQSAAASPTTTSIGSIPKQALATGVSGQPLTTSLSNEALKMGLSLGHHVGSINSEALSKIKNLPSGVQICLPGRTTSLGQTIDALSQSPKSTSLSVSESGPLAATSTGLVLVKCSNMVTSSAAQPSCPSPLTASSQLQGISPFNAVPQPDSPRTVSTVVTPPPGCIMRQDLGLTRGLLASNMPAPGTTTAQLNPTKTTAFTLPNQSQNFLSRVGTAPQPVTPSPSPASIVTHTSASFVKPASMTGNTNPFTATTTTPATTTTAGTIQQKIVINTTAPLAAGTQILLNNTCFVVPPQGLGPGSHVLIISSPAPQQVPSTSTAIPPQQAGPVSAAPRATFPGLPPPRLPGVPALSSPIVACTPAVGSPVLATTPNVAPVRLARTPVLGSPLSSNATKMVSSLPRLPAPQDLVSPVVGTPTLVSAPSRLASTPALVSPVKTSAPALGSTLPTLRLPAGTLKLAQCPPSTSTLSPALAPHLPRFPAAPLSLCILPNTPAVPLPSPVMPALAPLPSVVPQSSSVLAGTPGLSPAHPVQQGVSVATLGPGLQPQQTALRIPAPSTATSAIQQTCLYTGLANTSIKQQVATAVQPILTGTRTQVLPTVAVQPIVGTVSRMQSLPVATVQPIGGVVNSFQVSPVANIAPSSNTVIMTQAQPIRSLKTNETIHPPVVLTNQALGKPSLQMSASVGQTDVASKLLVSPDGSVLNTVQGQVNPAGLPACPKPLATLVVPPSSTTGRALPTSHINNSFLQPAQADANEP
ncbi:putative bromodomain-containing protein 10 [Polymixia lowei]